MKLSKCRCILTLDAGARMGIFEESKVYSFFEADLSDHIGKNTMRPGWELSAHYTVISDTGSTHTFSTSEFENRFVDIKEHRNKKINYILK